MKAELHPKYDTVKVVCSCGNTFETKSTSINKADVLHLDVCASCHPFYTGNQKIVDTAGQVERFNKKFAIFGGKKPTDSNT